MEAEQKVNSVKSFLISFIVISFIVNIAGFAFAMDKKGFELFAAFFIAPVNLLLIIVGLIAAARSARSHPGQNHAACYAAVIILPILLQVLLVWATVLFGVNAGC